MWSDGQQLQGRHLVWLHSQDILEKTQLSGQRREWEGVWGEGMFTVLVVRVATQVCTC